MRKINFLVLLTFFALTILLDLFYGLNNSEFGSLIFKLRGYRVLTALIGGGGLAVCGLVLQTWFRNSLLDPFLLGVNSGSNLLIALGVFGVSIFGVELSNYSLVLLGISGAIIALSFLLLINKFFESSIYLIIFGLLFSYLTSGIINFLMSFGSEYQLKSYLLFSFGSFEKVLGFDLLIYSALILAGVFFIFRSAKNLNYLLLGENYAVSLGVNIRRYQRFLIFLVGIVSGVIGVYCGPIVFIGMMGPHLVRFMLNESNHKNLVPLTFVAGGFLAVFSDVVATHFLLGRLPLNTVIGLIGTPVVGYVLLRNAWRVNNA